MKTKFFFIVIVFFYSCAFAKDCEGELSNQWSNCVGTINSWYGTYIGEFKNGMKHGKGTIHYYNGDKFVGEFKDDEKNGQGEFTYSSGESSSGTWEDDLFVGNNER